MQGVPLAPGTIAGTSYLSHIVLQDQTRKKVVKLFYPRNSPTEMPTSIPVTYSNVEIGMQEKYQFPNQ